MVTVKNNTVETVSITLTDCEAKALFKFIGLTNHADDVSALGDEEQADTICDIHSALMGIFE